MKPNIVPQGSTLSLLGSLVNQMMSQNMMFMSEGLELSGYVHLSVEFGAIAIFVG